VLIYGHLDKQPEMTGWREGLDPWNPVLEDGKLYGRGGADDGYAVFASLAAIVALQAQGMPHARCVGLVETCEESGSYDLRPISTRSRRASGASISSSGSIPAAATTSGCGRPRRCVVSPPAR